MISSTGHYPPKSALTHGYRVKKINSKLTVENHTSRTKMHKKAPQTLKNRLFGA